MSSAAVRINNNELVLYLLLDNSRRGDSPGKSSLALAECTDAKSTTSAVQVRPVSCECPEWARSHSLPPTLDPAAKTNEISGDALCKQNETHMVLAG